MGYVGAMICHDWQKRGDFSHHRTVKKGLEVDNRIVSPRVWHPTMLQYMIIYEKSTVASCCFFNIHKSRTPKMGSSMIN